MAEKQTHKERLKEITDSIETGRKELFLEQQIQKLFSEHEPLSQ